jgi:hypothetical protein
MSEDNQRQWEEAKALCRQFDQDLCAYLEGEDRPGVLAHARLCPFCRVVLADIEQIRFVGHHLALQEPPARLWANLRAALEAEGLIREQVSPRQRWLTPLGFLPHSAAAGALACLALLGVTLLVSPRNFQPPEGPEWFSLRERPTAAAALVPGVDDRWTSILEDMESAYRARESYLDPALQDTYRRSLKSLDASIEESLQQCRREPRNILAREYLVGAYQSKAEVLASALEFVGR